MNYLLLMYPDPKNYNPSFNADDECVEMCRELVDGLNAKGKYLGAGILQDASTARSVEVRDGQRLVTDGPFIETREQFAGYLLIEADSLEEALAVAEQHPVVHGGSVVIRPVKDVSFLSAPAASLSTL